MALVILGILTILDSDQFIKKFQGMAIGRTASENGTDFIPEVPIRGKDIGLENPYRQRVWVI